MDITLITYILGGIIIVLIIWIIRLEMRLGKFWRGKNGADIEATLQDILNNIKELEKNQHEIGTHVLHLDKKLRSSIRKVEMIRFNPFKDQGSNQSFAIALLNDEGDGVVLSSLYSRERMSIFAKSIKNKAAEFELFTEEKDVVTKALNSKQ